MKNRGEEIGEVIGTIVGVVGAISIGLWGLWCTWTAFFGGTLPIPFVDWQTQGNVWLGLVFLFIITPLLTAIGSQLFIWIIGIPVALLVGVFIRTPR